MQKKIIMCLEKYLFERMKDYRYGRFNLLKNKFKFTKNFQGNIKIKNFYKNDEFGEGDCVKLTNDFYFQNHDLSLVKVEGNEPKYFYESNSNHFYNLLFKKVDLSEFWRLDLRDKKYLIKKFNPLVVDSSFRLIVPFNESGYSIKDFYGWELESPDNLIFDKDSVGVPLGLKSNGELVFLGRNHGKINLSFKFPGYKIHNHIGLEDVSRVRGSLLRNDDLQSICVNLSRKYVEFIENFKKSSFDLSILRKAGL